MHSACRLGVRRLRTRMLARQRAGYHGSYADDQGQRDARQDGADGVMLLFDGSGKAAGEFTGQGNGWNKNSDINVQVFAHRLKRTANRSTITGAATTGAGLALPGAG